MPAPFILLFLEDGSTDLRSVNLYYEAPETVRCLVSRACEMWQWAKLADSRTATPFEGLVDQVIWKPSFTVATKATGGVSAGDAAAFRACLKMQLWPKDRKALHGLAGDCDQLSELCHEGVDSLEHRNYECVHTQGFRANLIEKFPNRFESMMRMRNRLFLDLGLVTGSFPVLPTHPQDQETWLPTKARFTGRIYIDGSAQFPAEPFLRRCGYSVVSLVDHIDWTLRHPPALSLAKCAVFGPLKRHIHTVPASETMALLCALRNADPPLQVGYDCKVVGDTWQGGSGHGTSAKSPLADLWRKIWAELDQPRWKGQFSMFKLKSHTQFDDNWTSDRKRDWVGNEVADMAAKCALQAWRSHAEEADQYCAWSKFAVEVAKSVARSQSFCLQNLSHEASTVQVQRSTNPPKPPRPIAPPPSIVLVEPHSTHAMWMADDFSICMRCGSWSKLNRPGRGLRGPCSYVPTKKGRDCISRVTKGRRPWE